MLVFFVFFCISELTEEAVLRPELQEFLEPKVGITDPVLDQSVAASGSQISNAPASSYGAPSNTGLSDIPLLELNTEGIHHLRSSIIILIIFVLLIKILEKVIMNSWKMMNG